MSAVCNRHDISRIQSINIAWSRSTYLMGKREGESDLVWHRVGVASSLQGKPEGFRTSAGDSSSDT